MKKRLLHIFLLLVTVTAVTLSSQISAAVRETVSFCIATLVPSLFPFLVLSKLLISSGFCTSLGRVMSPLTTRILGLSADCSGVFAVGLISGYPVGALSVVELLKNGRCTREEAQHLLYFCNNCGPAFMIGAVGGIFSSVKTGLVLWLIQLASVMLTALIFNIIRRGGKQEKLSRMNDDTSFDVTSAVRACISSMAVICAFAAFFSAICGILRATNFFGVMHLLGKVLSGELLLCVEKLIYGLLEVTLAVSVHAKNTPMLLAATAFACTFGGASVHMQTAAVCAGSGLSIKKYVALKLIQGAVAFALTLALCYAV